MNANRNRLPSDFEENRLLNRIITMHYLENLNQAYIAKVLGLSTSKVNRLIHKVREKGMIKIEISIPYQPLFQLEREIEKEFGIKEAVIAPELGYEDEAILKGVGEAAANYFLERLLPGDIICMGGGRAMLELVASIKTNKKFEDVLVVPAIGGVQGQHYTDVNYLVMELANRISATAIQLHAPAFVDSYDEQKALYSLRHVKETIKLARNSRIALLGIGSLDPGSSSYYQFTYLTREEIANIINEEQGVGEILAHAFNNLGEPVALHFSKRVIGINQYDLNRIPLTIGVASSSLKINAIRGSLKGRWINTLITDEITGSNILRGKNPQ